MKPDSCGPGLRSHSIVGYPAAIGAFIGAAMMLILSLLGFAHLRRVSPDAELGSHGPPAHV
jgi:hypothetical protein